MSRRLVVASCLAFVVPAFAGTNEGVTFLLKNQDISGSFGAATGEDRLVATQEALVTLRAVGMGGGAEAALAETFLANAGDLADSELVSRRALALAATGYSIDWAPTSVHGPEFDEPDSLHLSWALRALYSHGQHATSEGARLANELTSRADAAGCYGFADNPPSVEATAQAIRALRNQAEATYDTSSLNQSVSCLKSHQQPDGSFGSIAATAAAAMALMDAPGDNAAALTDARAYLGATQSADGSWEGSVRLTALATRALHLSGPDWRVKTDEFGRPIFALLDPEPLTGAQTEAVVEVENRSAFAAGAMDARFEAIPDAGGPAVFLMDGAVPALGPGQSATIRVQLPTSGLAGRFTVRVAIDPLQLVSELDELNNIGTARMNVRAENDLAVRSTSIQFAQAGTDQVQVSVTVRNLGVMLPADTPVKVIKGSLTDGIELGAATIPAGLGVNATATVSILWDATGLSGPTAIYAIVDPEDVIPEPDESNNVAFRFYYPGTSAPVDLRITSADISYTPAHVVAGMPFKMNAVVHNDGPNDANRVGVQLERSALGTAPLGFVELPFIAAGGVATAEFELVLHDAAQLRVVVDPTLALNDTNRANNSVNHSPSLQTRARVELKVTSMSVSPSLAPTPGQVVTPTATLLNEGTERAASTFRLLDRVDGALLAEVPVSLVNGQSETVKLASFVMPNRHVVLWGCVDPQDEFEEWNEKDNCAEFTVGAGTTDLRVLPEDVTVSPAGANIGERIAASAIIRNGSSTAATAVVEWWQGRPAFPDGVKLGETAVSVSASGSASTTFEWVRKDGPSEVFANVRTVVPRDFSTGNNHAGHHLYLRDLVNLNPPATLVRNVQPRVGPVRGGASPDLVVGYQANNSGYGPTTYVDLMGQTTTGAWSQVWRHTGLDRLHDLAMVDLDGDANVEVIVASDAYRGSTPFNARVTAIRPDGTAKWQQEFSSSLACNPGEQVELGIGHIDADAVADIVHYDGVVVRALSGVDGSLLWSTATTATQCPGVSLTVLDVEGDGANEVVALGQLLVLVDRAGAIRYQRSIGTVGAAFSVVDLDLNGTAELVVPFYQSALRAFDVATGNELSVGATFAAATDVTSAGAVRQDGLRYPVQGDSNFLAAFDPTLQFVWHRATPSDATAASLADLVGLGRPQAIGLSIGRAFTLFDGRTGTPLLEPPTYVYAPNNSISAPTYNAKAPPVVADVDADGRSEVVIARESDCGTSTSRWFPNQWPEYGCNQVLIFSSPHWKKQPALWPTRNLRRGQLNDNLTVSGNYRWWTTHNTWNQQFDVAPETLLADISLAASDLSASPSTGTAGEPMTLTATVRNVGGLAASDVSLSFYDGDPDQGGRHVGNVLVPGPLASRGGSAAASVTWTAYPEGEHFIYVVANADASVAESGTDNNQASFRLFVQPGTQLCDLAIDTSSVGATPSSPAAGEATTLAASISNTGPVSCPETSLAVYDGAASAGGVRVGATSVPALGPGMGATVSVQANPSPGTHAYRFEVDEDHVVMDGDRDNNEATLFVYASAATQPDLLLTDITVDPSPAYPNEPVVVTATVRNLGTLSPASEVQVRLAQAQVGGAAVSPLLPGETVAVRMSFEGPSAGDDLVLEVDPANAVAEFNEANNVVSVRMALQDPLVTISGTASPLSAGPMTAVTFSVGLSSTAAVWRDVQLDAVVIDASGTVVAPVLEATRVLLPPQVTHPVTVSWNTGSTAPGAHALRVTVSEEARRLRRGDVTFTIQEEKAVSAALAVDRPLYELGQSINLFARTTNSSRNASLSGAIEELALMGPDGAQVARWTSALPVISPGGYVDSTRGYPVEMQAQEGTYNATLEIRDTSGLLLASTQVSAALDLPPRIWVSGVSEGELSDYFEPTFGAVDSTLATVEATLNGAAFASGQRVDVPGWHELVVTATDAGGRVSTQRVAFRVVRMVPSFEYAACGLAGLRLEAVALALGDDGGTRMASNGWAQLSLGSNLQGDLVAGGDVLVEGASSVSGTVHHRGALHVDPTSTIGAAVQRTEETQPCGCDYDIDASFWVAGLRNDNAGLTQDPDVAPHLVDGGLVLTNAHASLAAGRYLLTHVSVGTNSTLTTDEGASVELFVENEVHVDLLSEMGAGPDGGALLVVSRVGVLDGGTPGVWLRNASSGRVHLYGPHGHIEVADLTGFSGAVSGLEVTLGTIQTFSGSTYDGALSFVCQ